MKKLFLSTVFSWTFCVSSFAQQPTISLFDLAVQDPSNYADAYDYWFPDNDTVTVMPVYLFDFEDYLEDVDSFSFSIVYNPNELQPVLDVINTVNTQSFITSVGYVLPIIQLAMVYGDTVMPDNLISTSINPISNNVEELSVSCTFYNDSTFYADSEGCLIYLPFKILERCGDTNYSIDIIDAELFSNTCSQNDYSMNFDGVDDVVEILTPSFNSSLNNLTLEVWVNLNSLQASQRILDQWGALGIYTLRVENNGTATMSLNLDGMSSGGYIEYVIPTNDVGQWVHVSVTYDGSNINLYRNGVLMNTEPTTGNPSASYDANSLYIGNNPLSQSMDGMIDEVRIWNIALTLSEIQEYMNCPPAGNETSLVGYWNFEEGSGNIVYDQTVNGNNGTINGASYSTEVPPVSYGAFLSSQDSTLSMVNGSIILSGLEVSINEFMGNLEAIVDNNFGNLNYTWSTGETTPYITPISSVNSYWVAVCDEEGCCDTSDVYSLSLEDVFSENKILLYPNPSKGDVSLSFDNKNLFETSIDIISVNGLLLKSYKTNNNCFLIKCNSIERGVYFIRVSNIERESIVKFILVD